MEVLKKYKKNQEAGFKDFVMNLDLKSSKVVKELLTNGLLEDPVYLKWALENKLGFDSLFKMEREDIQKVIQQIPNSRLLLMYSLKNHQEEMNFMSSHFSSLFFKQYMDDRELEQVTVSKQEDARIKIMEIIFALKEKGDLPPMEWKLPPLEILSGSSHVIDEQGVYKQHYDNGILALTGTIVKGKRHGQWTNYYPNGALHAVGEYQAGLKQNDWVIYFHNGKVKSMGKYQEDLKHGEWVEFEGNGSKTTIHYHQGKINREKV